MYIESIWKMQLMIDWLADWGAIASIIGLIVTVILTFYVRRLDRKQVQKDEQYYRHQTISNIRTITQHIIDVLNISTGEDSRTAEEQKDITTELKKYFRNNSISMRLLIQDCKFTLSKWITLKQDERTEIQYIIESLQWVLDKYFPDNENSDELQQRIWTSQYEELEKRKNKVTQTLEIITSDYNQ